MVYRWVIVSVASLATTLSARPVELPSPTGYSPFSTRNSTLEVPKPPLEEGLVPSRERTQEVYVFLCAGPFSYNPFLEFLSEKDLPVLCTIIETTEYYEAWGNAASAIGILGPSTASYQALTSYIRRPAEFREVSKLQQLHLSHRVTMLMWKISAIRWLPFLDPKKGTRCLRKILASEGAARRFLKDWDEGEIPPEFGDIQRAALELRAAAAQGLILHDAKAHRAEVRRQFHLMDQLVAEIPAPGEAEVSEDEALQNGYKAMLLSSLGGVLAIADYIEEHGTNQYLAAIGTLQLADDLKFRFYKIMNETSLH